MTGQEAGAALGRSILAPETEGLTQWKQGPLLRPGGGGCPGLRQVVAEQRGPGLSLWREGCSGDRLPGYPSSIREDWRRREGSAGPGDGVMPGVATGPAAPQLLGGARVLSTQPARHHQVGGGAVTVSPAPRGVQGAGARGPPREGLSTGCGDGASSRRLEVGIQFWGLQVIEARLPGLGWTPGQSLSGGGGLQGSRGSGAVTHPLLPSQCMEQWGQEEGCGGQNGGSTVTGCSLGLREGLGEISSWVCILGSHPLWGGVFRPWCCTSQPTPPTIGQGQAHPPHK